MSQRNKYANSNLNGVLSSQKSGSGYSQPYSQPTRYGSGLVSLGSSKKARLPASNSASKLAVPKPVNLPSLRKENAGNDPNTQIVPSGSGTSWQKVEEPAPAPADLRQTALSAGSTWASTQVRDSGWQPPAPQLQALPPPRPGSRRLNPHEYPSLSAAATPRQLNLPKQRVPSVPDSQGVANWDEDERRLPVAGPIQPAPPDRAEEDRGFRAPWEDRGDGFSGRGAADGYGAPSRGYDEDRWVPRGGQGAPPPPQRPYGRPPPGRFGSQDRFGDFPPFADDAALFPPPPPPSRQPPPPPRTDPTGDHASGGKSAEVDPEREAFLAELDRVAQDLEKERQRKLEQEVVVAEEEPQPEVVEPAPPAKEPSGPLTLAQVAAANVTEVDESAEPLAPITAKLARRQRELEEEEAERQRKEAAAAKLKALDEAIAAREAERRALEELAAKDAAEKRAEEEAKAARAAAEAAAIAHEKAETELAALTLEEKQREAAAMPARPASGIVSERAIADQDPEGSVHGSSIDVQANSSVAQDALSDDERDASVVSSAQDVAVPVPNAWKRVPLPNGTPDAWDEKPAPTPPPRGPKRSVEPSKAAAEQQTSDKKGLAGHKPERQPAAAKKAVPVQPVSNAHGPVSVDANGTGDGHPVAPPVIVQPKGPPVSWRKILAGDDGPSTPPQEPAQEERETRAVDGGRLTRGRGRDARSRAEFDGHYARDAGALKDGDSARSRGRGRGRGERPPRAAPRKPAEPTSPGTVAAAEAGAEASAVDSAAGSKKGRQRGDNVRGRGGRDAAAAGRGRGRGAKAPGRGAAVPVVPAALLAPEAPAQAAITPPPEASPAAIDAPVVAVEKQQPAPEVDAVPVIATVPPGLGWDTIAEPPGLGGWGTSVGGSLPIMSSAEVSLPLAADGRSSRFAPSLDPIAIKSPIAESSDPLVERPKSAAGVVGAVSRPRSASTAAAAGSSLGQDVLPNGIPALPADLSLESLPAPTEPGSSGFGGQRSSAASNAPIGSSAFPGVLFSLPSQTQGANMWQQFGQVQALAAQQGSTAQQQGVQDQGTFSLGAAKQSFYNAGGDQSFGSGSSYGGSGGINSNPQFGAFSNTQFGQGVPPGLQFGQLHTGFGAPFVPTGKQADWSTGAASKQPDWSTGPVGKQPDWSVGPLGPIPHSTTGQAFSRPGALESVVRHVPYTSQQPPSDALSRNGGLPQSNGNMEMHRQTLPEGFVGKAGETSTALHDSAAGLPDDVFSPEDIRSSVEPAVPMRGGPAAGGGRRGGRGRMGSPPMRGVPAGRSGYGRGRGREGAMDGLPAGNDGGSHQHQRRREGVPTAGQQRMPQARRHPGDGVPPQDAGGRDGGRGRGTGRARGGRGAGRGGQTNPVTAWVPLQQGA